MTNWASGKRTFAQEPKVLDNPIKGYPSNFQPPSSFGDANLVPNSSTK